MIPHIFQLHFCKTYDLDLNQKLLTVKENILYNSAYSSYII